VTVVKLDRHARPAGNLEVLLCTTQHGVLIALPSLSDADLSHRWSVPDS